MAGTLPFRPDLVVLNLAELQTIHVAEWHTGANAWVVAQSDYYVLDKNSSAVVSGSDIVAPIAGSPIAGAPAAKWIRGSLAAAPGAATQATWFIDGTNGIDTNDGAAAVQGVGNSGPLKTFNEYHRRIIASGGVVKSVGQSTVTLLTNLPASDPLNLQGFYVAVGSQLLIKGTTPTVLYTGTVTAITAQNEGANTPWDITDAALPAANSFTTFLNLRGRVTSGARAGATFWIAKDLGARKGRISSPAIQAVAYPFVESITFPTLVITDPYVIETLITVDTILCNAAAVSNATDGAFYTRIIFQDLSFAVQFGGFFLQQVNVAMMSSGGIYGALFLNCDVGGVMPGNGSSCGYISCRATVVNASVGTTVTFKGGLVSVGFVFIVNGGFGVLLNALVGQGADVEAAASGYIQVEPGGLGVFDSSDFGVSAQQGGTVYARGVTGVIYGSGNTDVGLQAKAQSKILYQTTKPVVVGTAGNTRIGGVITAYGAVPAITAANGAAIVLDA